MRFHMTVYAGYVDDPRNTDDAWMETIATLFLVPPGHPLSSMPLAAGVSLDDLAAQTRDTLARPEGRRVAEGKRRGSSASARGS